MANVFAPYGFLPIQSNLGGASNFEMIQAQILSSDGTKIFRGDPVKMQGSGFVTQMGAAGGGATQGQFWGIFWGCTYLSVSQGRQVQSQFWPGADAAANTVVASLIPIQGTASSHFRAQIANSSVTDVTGAVFADIGNNIDISLGSGNTFTGQSTAYADLNTLGGAATKPWTIVGLYGGLPGFGGFMGTQPGTGGPYAGSALGAFNWVILRANVGVASAAGV
jgi:hypothetical protein